MKPTYVQLVNVLSRIVWASPQVLPELLAHARELLCLTDVDPELGTDERTAGETALLLRRFLWLNHGCPVGVLYGDDGEMQCANTFRHAPIDFVRESLVDLVRLCGGHLHQPPAGSVGSSMADGYDPRVSGPCVTCGHVPGVLSETLTAGSQPAPPVMHEMADLLRSACAIADRRGEGTAWERFSDSIRALGLNGVTARTYRVLPSDEPPSEAPPAVCAHPLVVVVGEHHRCAICRHTLSGEPLDAIKDAPAESERCETCQLALPAHLGTYGIGVRGGQAWRCAVCQPVQGPSGRLLREEVVRRRRAHLTGRRP